MLCDLLKCKGACCIEGDSGAPLTEDEAKLVEEEYKNFSQHLPEKHKQKIKKLGFSIIDSDGDLVTPLVNNRQCAYSFYDQGGILKCSIEKAFFEGKTNFRKPVSCHLFPIRIGDFGGKVLKYEHYSQCEPALQKGMDTGLSIYEFCKEALQRVFGKGWTKKT